MVTRKELPNIFSNPQTPSYSVIGIFQVNLDGTKPFFPFFTAYGMDYFLSNNDVICNLSAWNKASLAWANNARQKAFNSIRVTFVIVLYTT